MASQDIGLLLVAQSTLKKLSAWIEMGYGCSGNAATVVGADGEGDAEDQLIGVDGLLPRIDEDLVGVLIAGKEREGVVDEDLLYRPAGMPDTWIDLFCGGEDDLSGGANWTGQLRT